ncbi:MAG TPA: HD domain-containing protein [Candidatus Hungatella pullicola]|nr:HD domain-containing protein [Candidatus Hungatella pullicola]
MVEKAVEFAKQAHAGVFRKGTKVPYIVHPLETAIIVSTMSRDEDVICAALLHDVIEDTPATEEILLKEFGPRITGLVMWETEDKSKCWKDRKTDTLIHLETASRENQIITLGDKLSNLRSTARDYLLMGEAIWQRFNEKRKSEHGWYYQGIAERLKDLEEYPAYQEFSILCRQVFQERD